MMKINDHPINPVNLQVVRLVVKMKSADNAQTENTGLPEQDHYPG